MSPDYIEASVRVRGEHAEIIEKLMLGQGALAVTLADCGDTPIWEPGVGETPVWEAVTVTGLFPGKIDAGPIVAALRLAPGVAARDQVSVTGLESRDWVRAWMDRFEAMQFGKRLWIVPSGQSCPDPEAIQLHLDPGLAFGTGTHPTTRLCLEWIDAQNLGGKTVLDFGCGSGVLGIAAAITGAERVICIDNDPQAITATRENARRNGVGDIVEALQGTNPGEHTAHVLITNILAGILTELAGALQNAVTPGGQLALTGILAEQADVVAAAYTENFPRLDRQAAGHWVLLSGVRALS